jgi:superfamily II DNA or RNA helicase/diadenosine tetraphosphate (Ap4A) HIT family hydrolase
VTQASCPFCGPPIDNIFYTAERVLGLWDAFPVSPGHALLIPRRHVAGWFDATAEERGELLQAIEVAKARIDKRLKPDGYNIGINVGRAAGQTVFHLHVHVIPRYSGDVPDPRGGVRYVIPNKANYLLSDEKAESAPGRSPEPSALVRGGDSDPLLPHLIDLLDQSSSVDIAAAFTMDSGVRLIEEHLRDVLDRHGRVRIVTGDYLGVTEPRALLRLLDLRGDIRVRIFESDGVSFHPKSYILTRSDGAGTAFVGSSNLSETALRRGVEWNFRVVTSRDADGFVDVVQAFDELWTHPATRDLDSAWVQSYQALRTQPARRVAEIDVEPVRPTPEPHPIQAEALTALADTRARENSAGLVVLATGLGKTWLSAFDSNKSEFRRVLFVAHREEILTQAMRTFRAIRPYATLGFYTGTDKAPDADVLFASIQTLGRWNHLHRFDPHQFDYVVVDEFHHAAAQMYRRVLGYFAPKFLLGLTATPERTDGGDLLSLCGHNLVYRCDVADGIRRGLLSPFSYYGVPDEVDYSNIPWKSTRFDEEELTQRVATRSRADNALGQYRRLGGTRTMGFCVSQRHADFMAGYFQEQSIRAVAVHSGERSAPRARSLEQLAAGDLDIVFAVDMFNEGVDLPNIDTVLMLRPTESRNLWLQQFGRGLRHLPGKTLRVIDYIGNHRIFLIKTRALLNLGSGDREVAFALDRLEEGTFSLPPGCSVTYELEAKDILRALIRPDRADLFRFYYKEFRETHGARPLAAEVFEGGYDPKTVRKSGYNSWLAFVHAMGDLSAEQSGALERHTQLLTHLEVTPMTKSYKMLVLLVMISDDLFPGAMPIQRLTERFADLARRYPATRAEIGDALGNPALLRRLIETNPINAWTSGRGTGDTAYFRYVDGQFSTVFTTPEELREAFQDLVREIAEWRLTVYIRRNPGDNLFVCRVSHASGRPILFLPDRNTTTSIPHGWQEIIADGKAYRANFVKVAINVVTRPGMSENVLPALLRDWFGPDAGQPGHSHDVSFSREGARYHMEPVRATD